MQEKKKSYIKLILLFMVASIYVVYQTFYNINDSTDSGYVDVVLKNDTGQQVTVKSELAYDDASRALGLMYRRSLDQNTGMLFLWKDSDIRSFWMRNTYIPLDMIFLNGTNVVGVVENAKPHTDTPRTVNAKANAVLEVNAGFIKRYGVNKSWEVSYSIPDIEVQ